MTASAAPLDLIRPEVDRSLRMFVERQRPLFADPQLAVLLSTAEDFLASGKRLRPAFCYWGWRAAGGGDDPALHAAAASLELLQASALIHDDVMDSSDVRRGMPAVHRKFEQMHRQAGWHGSAEQFGEGAAVLLGNLLLIWAGEMWRNSGMGPEALAAAQPVHEQMLTELMSGQYLDLLEQAQGESTLDGALRVALYKSGKYSVEQPLRLGLVLAAQAQHPWIDRLCVQYGQQVGIAFQLRDDILGVFGDPTETGKPAGDDLREGKRTILIARALSVATPAQAETVRALLGDPLLDADGVERLRSVILDTGALSACEEMIKRFLDDALHALDQAPIDESARTALAALAVAATSRRT
ncbi:polyprenyl synthetase family protein [Planotetraspora phitsanulokensis]|uniref:Geranylgeranyl pyrophosphate synthase n=1 Tax=Planotetraspora phitsanulokensis TaxID=575192 RepID=A0A8J3U0Q7_9ACTN|nr:polyprenyl synthetase family protein [Planotetraspora phitsanulokensis]GII35311.1 geranylgeranyl pyrophosphate synthase [Planotetraspora phitsanulokensis]